MEGGRKILLRVGNKTACSLRVQLDVPMLHTSVAKHSSVSFSGVRCIYSTFAIKVVSNENLNFFNQRRAARKYEYAGISTSIINSFSMLYPQPSQLFPPYLHLPLFTYINISLLNILPYISRRGEEWGTNIAFRLIS